MKHRHLTSLIELSTEDILEIFDWSERLKTRVARGIREFALQGKTVGLIFEKASMRTRVSFEVGINQLGGNSVYMDQRAIGLGTRESVKDVGRVISRYLDGIVIRTFEQENINQLAEYATVPIINGLSDEYHPCQALADMFTIKEKLGGFESASVAFVGDGNNVARSAALACAKLGIPFSLAAPESYGFTQEFTGLLDGMDSRDGFSFLETRDPKEAVKNANIVYTDTWTSMGQEEEANARRTVFADFQVNADLLNAAKEGVLVMHCLPAHRGEEITDEVMDGPASIVYDQAENRLHVQRAVLRLLIGS
ncbi:MAG: ornithine carbamoyltransferase [Planctomycetota bacterium]|jgi:ornithine carbamoyltransferase|nr:ornithine carbamoyltransferase [Planctomycetota bacterium]MDP7133971.1 ornithine carbamoyltransferase [Planctomycetota bacterium]MDP7250047.1 ornithine carbamoyltransferase [Planctomycetota bacterium]